VISVISYQLMVLVVRLSVIVIESHFTLNLHSKSCHIVSQRLFLNFEPKLMTAELKLKTNQPGTIVFRHHKAVIHLKKSVKVSRFILKTEYIFLFKVVPLSDCIKCASLFSLFSSPDNLDELLLNAIWLKISKFLMKM